MIVYADFIAVETEPSCEKKPAHKFWGTALCGELCVVVLSVQCNLLVCVAKVQSDDTMLNSVLRASANLFHVFFFVCFHERPLGFMVNLCTYRFVSTMCKSSRFFWHFFPLDWSTFANKEKKTDPTFKQPFKH